MVKTIQLQDRTYKRLRTYGVVGQSFNDFVEDILDFIDDYEDEFGKFLDKIYGETEEDAEGEENNVDD